ncbi:unnamed protein product, partial [Ectocarpus sp. 4 AP-2014]
AGEGVGSGPKTSAPAPATAAGGGTTAALAGGGTLWAPSPAFDQNPATATTRRDSGLVGGGGWMLSAFDGGGSFGPSLLDGG